MDLLCAYADAESDDDPTLTTLPKPLPTLSSAPTARLTPSEAAALSAPPTVPPAPNPNKHAIPTGTVEHLQLDPALFDAQERRFGTRGLFADPETGRAMSAAVPPLPVAAARARDASPPPVRKRARATPLADEAIPAGKKGGRGRAERAPLVPTTELFLPATVDYQGRSWLEPPRDARTFEQLETYTPYIPQRCVHTLPNAHRAGVSALRFFPATGHLLLSVGLDGCARIWHTERRACIRLYSGHAKGIRDVCFSNDGRRFLTASYDCTVKLWDTETGKVLGNFEPDGAIPYCVKFNPDADKQNEFLAGCGNRKIVQVDVRNANSIVQEYDRHMGPVNSITFVDDNRRFVSSADDKLLCVWEYGIPVVIKYISDPTMHSMPVTLLHPNRKWLACQSMDNRVLVYSARDRFKQNAKKVFKGHFVAGYACGLTFSTDGRFIGSGDSIGRLFFWDWKTGRMYRSLQAHKGVCIGLDWHPTSPSLVASCGWDGSIKFWD